MLTVKYSNETVLHKGECVWKLQKREYLLIIAFRLHARCHGVVKAHQIIFSSKKPQTSKKDDYYKNNYNIV